MERTGACRAFNSFLNSAAGKVIKDRDGGELTLAIQAGLTLDMMMYSYRTQQRERGSASRFVTSAGVREIVQKLPNVGEVMKEKVLGVFDADSMSFAHATPEQCAREDAEEEIEEIFDSGCGGGFNEPVQNEQTTVVSWKTLNELRMAFFQSETERKYLRDRLDLEEERKLLHQANKDNETKVAVAAVQVENAQKAAGKEKERADEIKLMAQAQTEKEKGRADKAEEMAKERVEREKERADRAEAMATERLEREKVLAATLADAANERFAREKTQQETEFLRVRMELELKAKDMELENVRLQLELEKMNKKRCADAEDVRSGGSKKKSSPAASEELTFSPQVALMPYSDPMTREAFRGQGRKYRWVLVYSADSVLEASDFKDEVKRVITTVLKDDEYMTLVFFKTKFRSCVAPIFVRDLHSRGRITGRALIEAPWSATHRFVVSTVQHREIQSVLLDSPSLERDDGIMYCKMRLVVE